MIPSFKMISASFVGALVVALLGLITNFVSQEKMILFIVSVAVFVIVSGIVAYLLNATSVNYAEQTLDGLQKNCELTLSHIRNSYTSSILRGSIIHDSELDTLERSTETQEIWVVTPLNLDHDTPGKAFFQSLKENLDVHEKKYTYVIKDSERARHNARAIAEKIKKKKLMRFIILTEKEWNKLPIAGIPVTIHNPQQVSCLRIYISTQQSHDRGQHWAVFSGWTTAQIIERTRAIINSASKEYTLEQYSNI